LDDDIDLDTILEDFVSRNLWKRFLQGNKAFLFEVILIVTVLVFNIIIIYYYGLNICFKLTFIISTIYFNLYIKKFSSIGSYRLTCPRALKIIEPALHMVYLYIYLFL
jgi:hypothetical protein